MEVSETIRKRREELDLTLLDIAKKVGVSEATIQRYESGKIKNIRQDKIVRLAAALKLTPTELLGWNTEDPDVDLPQEITVDLNPNDLNDPESRLTDADDIIALLEKLSALHSKGVLTDAEYTEKKRDLLDRL